MPTKRPAKRTARANKSGAKPSIRPPGQRRKSPCAKPGQPLPPMLPRTSGQVTPNDKPPSPPQETDKTLDLQPDTLAPGEELTTNQGVAVSDDQNSLKSHVRGPTLLEDILMREKITHFDHERIPERVVHARGAAAHGFFQVYESQARSHHGGAAAGPGRRDAGLRALLDRGGLARLDRHAARRARLCRQVLYPRRRLGPRRQQHAGVLHPGRQQVPRSHPRGEARAPQRDPAGAVGPRHLLGFRRR